MIHSASEDKLYVIYAYATYILLLLQTSLLVTVSVQVQESFDDFNIAMRSSTVNGK